MEQLVLDLSRPPAPTLDNYAPGSNGEAVSVLHAWLSGALPEPCIYLWGPRGCGKTHLLRAATRMAQGAPGTAAYIQASEVETLEQDGTLPSVIVIDDVDRLSAAAQGALFRMFQRVREEDVRLLAAGDIAPAGLTLRDDVRTRLGAGLVFQLRLLSDAENTEALRDHAAARGFTLAPEIADYLLRRGQRDLPSLLAVLDALDQYSLQAKRPITLSLVRELLHSTNAASR
jgi:DnaA family protein